MPERREAVRAGFWRRFGALLVDTIIVTVVLELVAVIAFQTSSGRVQLTEGFRTHNCTTLAATPPDLPALPFVPNESRLCSATIFGWPIARTLDVRLKGKDGSVDSETLFAADEDGRPIRAIFLDWLWIPMLILFRLWRDRDVGSPGRLAVNTHLAIRSPGSNAASAINKRYALFALPWLPLVLFELWIVLFGTIETTDSDLDITKSLNSLAALVLIIAAAIPIVLRRDAFYDRFAGTAVMRDNPPKD